MDSKTDKESERIKTAKDLSIKSSSLLCGWLLENSDIPSYTTGCGHLCELNCGDLAMKFCCYCSKEIDFYQSSAT